MCRIFGQHAHPGLDACEPLCCGDDALRFQSRQHPHGWGIGWYDGHLPEIRLGTVPAHQHETFVDAARAVRARIVLAHLWDASIAPIRPENTHPFRHGRWLFAHGGKVARFRRSRRVREAIAAEVDADLRTAIHGDTDSEYCFFVFLSRLRARAPLESASLPDVRRALAETTDAVLRIAAAGRRPPASSLNFLVSDGRVLAACRRGRPLHLACDVGRSRAIVVASERTCLAAWEEVEDGGFVATEDGVHAVRGPLRECARGDAWRPGHSSPEIGNPRGQRTS